MFPRGPVSLRNGFFLILALAGVWTSTGLAQPPSPAKVALLVGVNQYEKRYFAERPLQYAERDVEHMAAELKKNGFTVKLLKGSLAGAEKATKSNIDAAMAEMLTGRSSSDIVLIGFAGHGQQLPLRNEKGEVLTDSAGRQMEEAYYCPVDATFTEANSLIGLTSLVQMLDVKGGINLLLVDACRDNPDTSRGARSISGNELNGRLPRNTALMFSCSAGQQALETDKAGGGHGVFFHHVLLGLQGEAKNARGEVTWGRLVEYVAENTNPQAKEWFPDRVERAINGRVQTPHELRNLSEIPVLARVGIAPVVIPPVNPVPVNPSPNPPPNSPPSGGNLANQPAADFTSSIGLKMKLIPNGEFVMGSPLSEAERFEDETQHRVEISKPFLLGMYEVTQDQYQVVMGKSPSWNSPTGEGKEKEGIAGQNTGQFPVEQVSWFDAIEFCNKLSLKERLSAYYSLEVLERDSVIGSIKKANVEIKGGTGYRLPTEAEWEYSCRAGTVTALHFGNLDNGEHANVDGRYPYGTTTQGPFLGRTTTVGSYLANGFGLFDMHGNVSEWCFDLSLGPAEKKALQSVLVDPVAITSELGDGERIHKVHKGGDYSRSARLARAAWAMWANADDLDFTIGFRVAKTL